MVKRTVEQMELSIFSHFSIFFQAVTSRKRQ